jgi:predicted ferric reductase
MTAEFQVIQGQGQAAVQGKPNLVLVPPTGRVRLGVRKMLRVKRSQDFAEILGWSTVLAVVSMFLTDGGAAHVVDWVSGFSAFSRLTALLATDLLLIHMLLIARVPWIDKLYGHDRATIAHKKLGKPVLYLAVAHFLASTIGFAISDGKNLVDEYFYMLGNLPDMLTASIGLGLMILVVITSIRAARKRLSYEVWYVIHITAYAAVLAAVPHQFSTGSDIAGKPLQSAFWIILYLFVAGNIVWYRVLEPIVKSFARKLRVQNVVVESSDTVSVYIGGTRLEKLQYQAGQFFILRILTAKQWWRPHPFSVSAAPNSRFVRFSIGNRGDDTSLMPFLQKGTRVILEGPYGVFTEERRSREKVVLIAAGIGVPPIRALAESLAARQGDVTIIYRTRNNEDAALLGELQEIAKRRGFALHVLAGKRAHPQSWLPASEADVPDHARITQMAPWISESDVFICGPGAWTKTVEKSLVRAGTPVEQIHAEEFAW